MARGIGEAEAGDLEGSIGSVDEARPEARREHA
jgi:hypothetical protein